MRNWATASRPETDELDVRLEQLLLFLVMTSASGMGGGGIDWRPGWAGRSGLLPMCDRRLRLGCYSLGPRRVGEPIHVRRP